MSICKNNMLAEEAVQNSFVNAYKYIQTYKGESAFKTWLLRIVFNETIKIQKSEMRFQWQDMPDDNIEEDKIFLNQHSLLHQKETKEQVANALLKLNEKEAVVLNLFYLEEQSVKEVCSILGYSESNVKVLLHRARKNFKNVYEKL
jgi:RNA polymerase sigma-70 factor (ECF subfamily)